MTVVMLLVFSALLVLALPVGYALVISSGLAAVTAGGMPSVAAVVKIFQPTQSFPLLAIPFFMLSGNLMMGGTLGKRLIDFATKLVGRFHGGLGQVTVVGSTVFGGVSGSAVAEASALGSMLIPWQKREGYPPAFAAAATASSSVIAGLIPPSIPLILYAAVSNQSIAALFLAGILPGLMLCGGFMLVCYFSGRLRGFKRLAEGVTWKGVLRATVSAAPALAMPAFIVILLRAGIATPTEVSVLAVFYGLMVSALVYRDLSFKRLYDALVHTAVTTGVVMLVIAASNLVGFVLTVEAVPTAVAEWTVETLKSPWMVILMLNLIMVTVGMFLDLPAAILLLGPTFVAIGNAIGLDLVQLGIMMAVNLSIGLFTPPVGTTLFISAAISRQKVGAVVRELWPFYLVAITVLLLISFVPAFTLY
ncbi:MULTISPECIES: TRAP transporter large permease [unclassified Thauera]|nr:MULTISPECIES: TRAP transporter large permease [unclassified Thauera]MDG3065627.1 TRAP transporter large permease [Thauera mechernichensis]ENO91974.1 putative transmembrane protein [Thauera sp. 28]HAG76142.1 TRAP transporter large permease [Thauera sp.]HAY09094.1 TRAP transporter large permease [Thauera sp.]HNS93492.1 TRAP transporter large permease [Thauera sp.]